MLVKLGASQSNSCLIIIIYRIYNNMETVSNMMGLNYPLQGTSHILKIKFRKQWE